MAKLKDFIDQVSFDEVWALLGQDRENMEQYKEACQSIYSELQAATPAENTDHMTIRFVMEEAPEWMFFFDDDTASEGDGAEAEEAEDDAPTLQVYGFIPVTTRAMPLDSSPRRFCWVWTLTLKPSGIILLNKLWQTAWRK